MHLLVLSVLVMSYGCRACVITGHPEDTVADIGENATLTCSTNFTKCRHGKCAFHWQHQKNNAFEAISACEFVYSGHQDRYSVSSGPDWSLTITGVQANDVGRYRCSIYSGGTNPWAYSSQATLIIPSLIDISVQPPRHPITTGDNATFHCTVQSNRGALPTLNVKWFVNGTDVRRFQDQSFYHVDNDGHTLTFLKMSVNNTNVRCKTFSETNFVKRSDNYLILTHPQKPIKSATQVPATEEPLTVNPAEFPHDTDEPSVTEVSETGETETSQPPCSCTHPTRVEEEHTNDAIIAVSVCGVSSLLFNIVLIYLRVGRRQCKVRRNTSRKSDADQNAGDDRAYEEMETQLQEHSASTVTNKTTPSSYQELIFK